MRLEFGKYKGQDLADVPREYVEWLIENKRKDLKLYETELERRDLAESASQGMVERLVQAGFRALAKSAHPDTGGSQAEFLELQAAKAQLDQVLAALKGGGE